MLCKRHWLSVYRTCNKIHRELRLALKIRSSAGEQLRLVLTSETICLTLSFVCGRALEASLAERQGSLQHIGLSLTGISVDPLNPHERERQGQSPVGLKNIGNTCWFSAVIQVRVSVSAINISTCISYAAYTVHVLSRCIALYCNVKLCGPYSPQSLFHIPEFRAVVLQFQQPPLSGSEQSQHHCLLFLVELRRLFALMVASQRKYINPQRAIQVTIAGAI